MSQLVSPAVCKDRPPSARDDTKIVAFPRNAVRLAPRAGIQRRTAVAIPAGPDQGAWAAPGYAELAKAHDLRAVLGL